MGGKRFLTDSNSEEFEMFPRKKANPILVSIQLFGIFLLVRTVMIVSGVTFKRIPLLDDLLRKLVSLLRDLG